MANLRAGLLNINGAQHRQRRRLMSPAFHVTQVATYRDAMVAITQNTLDAWRFGERRDVEHEMRRLVHRIAMKTVLSLEDPQDAEALSKLIEQLLSAASGAMLFPFDLPGTSFRRMLRTAEQIVAFLVATIGQKRTTPAEEQDILAAMVATRDENGIALSNAELVAEAYSILCHETSASAMTWILLLLAQHPRVQADLLDELNGLLHGDAPTIEQLERLPMLEWVIKESLRLLPPAPFGSRYNTEPCQFGSWEIPKDAVLFFSQYITHRLPEIYSHPNQFLPERWEGFKPTPYEYFPFGAGAHNCIGGTFAMVEIKIVLAMLLQRYRLRVAPGTRIDRCFRMSLTPRHGLPMIIATQDRQFAKSEVRGNIHEMIDFNS